MLPEIPGLAKMLTILRTFAVYIENCLKGDVRVLASLYVWCDHMLPETAACSKRSYILFLGGTTTWQLCLLTSAVQLLHRQPQLRPQQGGWVFVTVNGRMKDDKVPALGTPPGMPRPTSASAGACGCSIISCKPPRRDKVAPWEGVLLISSKYLYSRSIRLSYCQLLILYYFPVLSSEFIRITFHCLPRRGDGGRTIFLSMA